MRRGVRFFDLTAAWIDDSIGWCVDVRSYGAEFVLERKLKARILLKVLRYASHIVVTRCGYFFYFDVPEDSIAKL